MYKIKQNPEDFIVKEINSIDINDSGKYLVCLLKKRNYNTIRAVQQIANALSINVKHIGFAGAKDKNAITEQYISITGVKKDKVKGIKLKDIELEFVGYSSAPISLGDLKGNEFIISVRNLTNKEIEKVESKLKGKLLMPNYYGEQRFSKDNVQIGRNLIKSKFKESVELILKTDPDCKEDMNEHLRVHKNDFIGALNILHKKLLMMYVHAYQSYLWNKCLDAYLKKSKKDIKLPLIGFGTEIEDDAIEKIIDDVMEEEGITFRSFINKQISVLSLEGAKRDAFVEIENLEILEKGEDFVKISFNLSKSSYATIAISFLLD